MNRRLYLILQSLAWRSQRASVPVIQKTDPSGSEQPATEGAMTYTRMNFYNLPDAGQDQWPDWFLWYARGIKALNALPITDKLSWRYYAAIHGFNELTWTNLNVISLGEKLPDISETNLYWNQCQHRTWYFLPWHRGYLLALEAALRDVIGKMDKAPTDWSFCYWNYLKSGENKIPDPFLAMEMPDGEGPNPLYVAGRVRNEAVASQINATALDELVFTSVPTISSGFGGPKTGFKHLGANTGALENQPHNIVHGNIGGLMASTKTAALDPIFWLHHANIDRLWQVWRLKGRSDPTDTQWLDGPASLGERAFIIPKPGDLAWTFTPSQMTDIAALGYTYESFDVLGAVGPSAAEPVPQEAAQAAPPFRGPPSIGGQTRGNVMFSQTPQLAGANDGPLFVVGREVDTVVQIDSPARQNLKALSALAGGTGAGGRLAMNIENVRGDYDAVTLSIFITPPGVQDATGKSDVLVGSIGLFDLEAASQRDGPHGGDGLNFILDLTDFAVAQNWQGEDVTVRIVSLTPVPDWANIIIGRISVYWQGA